VTPWLQAVQAGASGRIVARAQGPCRRARRRRSTRRSRRPTGQNHESQAQKWSVTAKVPHAGAPPQARLPVPARTAGRPDIEHASSRPRAPRQL
jgi:hypothetical protein